MNIFRGIFMSALLTVVSLVSFSQFVVTIGSDEYDYTMLPLDPNFKYSYTQQIYTAEELSVTSGDIVSISFYYTSSPTRTIDVYLQSTTLSVFESPYANVPVSSSDLVYSGSVSFVSNDWTTITFSEPYHYEGGNLLLTIDDNTGSYLYQMYAKVFDCDGNQSLAHHSDNTDYNPSDVIAGDPYINTFKNKVKFAINNAVVSSVINFPWSENFESGTFETNGMSQEIISGNKEWTIESTADIYEGLDGEYSAFISNISTQHNDSAMLCTPPFTLPADANMIKLTFNYINRLWSPDFDGMQVVCINENGRTVVAEYTENHEEWQSETLYIDASVLTENFRIGFIGIPAYGYGFAIDNITIDKIYIDVVETSGYIQVGTQSTYCSELPVYPYYNYQYSQQIFSNLELKGEHTIYSLSFYAKSENTFSRNVKIYLGHTTADSFCGDSEWVPASQLTLVYDGEFNVNAQNEWIVLNLDTPFEYNGQDNLVLVVDDNTGEWYSVGTTFAYSRTKDTKILRRYSDDENYGIDDIDGVGGDRFYSRNNVRFGLHVAEKYNIEVMSSDTLKGSACCSGEYYEDQSFRISATPNFGFVFDRWNDGETENPRTIVVEGATQYVAYFTQIGVDTLRYDNDVVHTPIGNHGNAVEWGIRIPHQNLANRSQLTDVSFYVDGQYAFGNYKLNVYQGFDTIPSQPVYTDSVMVAEGTEGWISFEISPVSVDSTLPMWIILSTDDVAYPAIASTCLDNGTDGRWWNATGTWGHQSYGAWMIKAVLPYEGGDNDVEEVFVDNIGVYPNPAGSQIYLTGISEGETVEIYNMTGKLVANFIYNGGAVDIASFNAGLYVIRCNGICTKFVKE